MDLSTDLAEQFLPTNVDRTVNVVTLYVDITCSTKMSFALPAKKLERIIQVFSQEMSMIIEKSEGYVLKFVGDTVIAIFPAETDAKQASKNALDCAKNMIEVFTKCINPLDEIIMEGKFRK
jgi:adenylate cyclase